MSVIEGAAVVIAVAFTVLIAYLVPLLIQFRKTLAESAEFMECTKNDLPPLLAEMRTMSQSVSDLTEQLRSGVEHASGFLHAVGNVGDTLQTVNDSVRGRGGMLLVNAASLVAGVRAASAYIKRNSDG